MVKGSAIAHALLEPAAVFVIGVLIVWQLVAESALVGVDCAIVVLGATAFLARWALRRRQLLPLLVVPPQPVRRLAPADFGVHRDGGPAGGYLPRGADDELERELASRRIVVLCGERLSGRSRTAYEALRRGYEDYVLLRPRTGLEADAGRSPLSSLLVTGVLSRRRRYVLWLDDIGALMQAGLEPRIVEQWLAAGPGRAAVGTITPTDLERIRITGTSQAFALERAVYVTIEVPPELPPLPSAAEHEARVIREGPQAGWFVRIVAMCELLRLPNPPDEILVSVLQRVSGRGITAATVQRLCSGTSAPLRRREDDGTLAVRPELLQAIDPDLLKRDEDWKMIAALTGLLDPGGLLALGLGLTERGYLIQAEFPLARAKRLGEQTGEAGITPAVTRAMVDLYGRRAGRPSGATLSWTGGLDFNEVMGPEQRDRARELLQAESDGDFDPSLPPLPEREGRLTRFYRHRLNRAATRIGALAGIDTLAITLASIAALAVRADARHRPVRVFDPDLWKLVLAGAIVTILVAVWLGLYRAGASRARPQLIIATMTVLTMAVAAGFFIAHVDFGSLTALFVLFVAAVVVDGALRYAFDLVGRRWVSARHLQARVLIMGRGHEAHSCAKNVRGPGGRAVQPVAFLSPLDSDNGSNGDPFCVGTYDDLTTRLRELHINELIIADRALNTSAKAGFIAQTQALGVDVRYVANDQEIVLGAVGRIGDQGLVHVPAALITPERLELKRILDHALLIATLPAWGAVILAYAAYSALRRRGQPIFVTAARVGLGETGYSMLRLRTRTVHPDRTRGKFPTGRVEEWLERTGLDELPQVVNILRDEMSVVGPRPLAAADVEELNPDQRRSLGARPGMTGRWQVTWPHGASEADMRAMDADYLRRWRVFHDLEVIIRTPIAIILRGRYLGDTEIRRRRARVGDPDAKLITP